MNLKTKMTSYFSLIFFIVASLYAVYKGYPALILLALIQYIALSLHEIGHIIFGLISGYKFVFLKIPFLLIYKDFNKIIIRLKPTITSSCLALPLKEGKYLLYYFGGFIANAICCILAVVYILSIGFNSIALVILIFNLITALVTIIPMIIFGQHNDGHVIFESLQSREATHALYLQQYEMDNRIKGMRFRDYDDNIFQISDSANLSNTLISQIVVFEAKRLYDKGEYEKCFDQYNRLRSKKLSTNYLKSQVYNDIIYYHIIHNPNYEKARILFNNKKIRKYLSNRTMCAFEYFVNQDELKSMKYLEEIKKEIAFLSKMSDGGSIMEKEYSTRLVDLIGKQPSYF
jgi:hypothetical protein